MTREKQLARLQMELKAAEDGVFVVVSARAPILDGASTALTELLDAEDLGGHLRSTPGNGPVEVVASKGVRDDLLRSLNHRRDQLRVGRSILLVFDPSDCARVSRIADDLWKWATVVELDPPPKTWGVAAARGVIEEDRYAPALRPGDVIGPRSPLTARSEDSDP